MDCRVFDLGKIEYTQAYQFQRKCVDEVILGRAQALIFCEHPAVITLGRMTKDGNLLLSSDELTQRNIALANVDRGGDVTLHAPGQLVIYPILNLANYGKDLHLYLQKLEQVVIDLLKDFGILANRKKGKTGIWIGEEKIASLGIGVSKWVAFHGIGLNVNTDLELFKAIRPCGMDIRMTSLARLFKAPADMSRIRKAFMDHFSVEFGLTFIKEPHEKYSLA